MKNLILIILCLIITASAFADNTPIVRIDNVEDNGAGLKEVKPMTGFKLLEFDPKTKSIKKLPDVEADKAIQNEIKADDIKKEEDTKKFKLERIKFDGFED